MRELVLKLRVLIFNLTMNSSTFCGWFQPRLQDYPRGLGKGSDAAVVGAWLEHVLDNLSLDQCPASRWPSNVLESKCHHPKKWNPNIRLC